MNDQLRACVSSAISRINGKAVAVYDNGTKMVSDLRRMMEEDEDFNPEAVEAEMRKALCDTYGLDTASCDKPFAFAGGVAVIPIHGSLINRFGGYYGGWITGYNFIRSQRNAALADPDVKSIVYDVNSGGGEVSGCFELAREMAETRSIKPSMAVVDSSCYSAAYALASGAERIVVTPSGGAGSIGVLMMHYDESQMMQNWGIKVTVFRSGTHKAEGNPYEPLSDSAKKTFQTEIDTLRDEFVQLVAENRNLDPKAVRDTEAMCYNAQDALALGLIDAVTTPAKAVADFINGPQDRPEHAGANAMTTFTQEQVDAARNDAAAKASAEERTRVSSIMGSDAAKTRPNMAAHMALKTNMSAEDALSLLSVAAEETPAATTPAATTPAATTPAATTPAATTPVADESQIRAAIESKVRAEIAAGSPFAAAMNSATHPNAGADVGVDSVVSEEDKELAGLMAAAKSVAGDQWA